MSSTSSTSCQHCTAATADGIALCDRCQRTVRYALTNITAYYADLDRVPTGAGLRRRGSATPDPTGVTAAEIVLDPVTAADLDATNTLTTWARCLVDDRPGVGAPPPRVPELAPWLAERVRTVATLAWAGAMVKDLLGVERTLKRVADRARTGSYLGVCGHTTREEVVHDERSCGCACHIDLGFGCDVPGGCGREYAVLPPEVCGHPLYAGHDQQWVSCRCGATWDVRARRRQLVRAAEDELAPVAVIARLAAVFTGEASVGRLESRIRQWVQREKLTHITTKVIDGRPRRVYRVGDVLDLLTSDTPTRHTA